MNGNVSGKLRQSLSSREVAKTKLREESRKLDKGLNDLCTLLFWSLEQTKFLGMLELQFSIWAVSGCAGHWEKIVSLNKSHSATEIWGWHDFKPN